MVGAVLQGGFRLAPVARRLCSPEHLSHKSLGVLPVQRWGKSIQALHQLALPVWPQRLLAGPCARSILRQRHPQLRRPGGQTAFPLTSGRDHERGIRSHASACCAGRALRRDRLQPLARHGPCENPALPCAIPKTLLIAYESMTGGTGQMAEALLGGGAQKAA